MYTMPGRMGENSATYLRDQDLAGWFNTPHVMYMHLEEGVSP
jgi:hypothetical protein